MRERWASHFFSLIFPKGLVRVFMVCRWSVWIQKGLAIQLWAVSQRLAKGWCCERVWVIVTSRDKWLRILCKPWCFQYSESLLEVFWLMILVKLSKESCSVNCIYSPCFGSTRILQSSLPSSCLPSLRDCHAGSQELGGITLPVLSHLRTCIQCPPAAVLPASLSAR